MKVLFAVSNESISESIVKKYQQMYKEIISSKNVYYFNAIIKELQKDKSYDRIVISEDLEPFASKNYDTIDNFLFEKLDSISDEASNVQGEDIPIILISTDRRTKGENLLVKLFGIGVYSALIGQDRSIEQVCNLINKPRSKKEAKIYYKISSNEVEYKAESEGNVSEIEIQNILAHYKRLGKNEEKYVDSFNSIANQYTDGQLRLIVKFLPLNVKAVLEANCPKYQQIVAYSGNIEQKSEYRNPQSRFSKKQEKQQKADKKAEKAGLKIEALKNEKNNAVLSKPVIIPSEVTTKNVKKVELKATEPQQRLVKQQPQINKNQAMGQNNNGQTLQENMPQRQAVQENIGQNVQQRNQAQNSQLQQKVPMQNPQMQQVQRQQMANQNMQQANQQVARQMPQQSQVRQNAPVQDVNNQDRTQVQPQSQPVQPKVDKEAVMQEIESIQEQLIAEQPKRGRGRPRKVQTEDSLTQNNENKPKRGRGRPRKVQPEEVEQVNDVSNEENIVSSEPQDVLPGFDEYVDVQEEQNVVAPDNNYTENEMVETYDDETLPGFEDIDNVDNVSDDTEASLPGFDDYEDNSQEDGTLPGFNDVEENTENETGSLPGFDDYEDNSQEDGTLPGFDSEVTDTQDDTTLPGFDDVNEDVDFQNNDNFDDGMMPGFENYDESEFNSFDSQDDGMLPGMEDYSENPISTTQNEVQPFDNANQEYGANQEFDAGQQNNDIIGQSTNDMGPNYDTNIQEEHMTTQTPINNMSTDNLVSGDQKIVGFVGTSKNGTSFIVDNLAHMLSRQGIKTAILDLTKNRNAYYIYTKNEEELRKTAMGCMKKLEQGMAEGIKVNANLDVYTAVPGEEEENQNIDNIVNTLMRTYSLILVDCDFKSDYRYIAKLQELYLVQSMDVLTIQPLTAYLRDLKAKGILDQNKLKIVINKYVKVRSLTEKTIIGGMAFYNDPAMSFMTELFNRETIKYTIVPFDAQAYSKYLEGLVNCEISTDGYSKEIMTELRKLANMVYPLVANTQKYEKPNNKKQKSQYGQYEKSFSPQMNNTLNKMKNNY